MKEMYPGAISDENIRNIFRDAGDFNVRELTCGQFTLHGYAIDGLTSGGDISEYVFKPIVEQLQGKTMEELYTNALEGVVVNSVAKACQTLTDAPPAHHKHRAFFQCNRQVCQRKF